MDGQWQELWTPALSDPDFSALSGRSIQFDYQNNSGFDSPGMLYLKATAASGSSTQARAIIDPSGPERHNPGNVSVLSLGYKLYFPLVS